MPADPPFVLLLVAAGEDDRRRLGGLLADGSADVHWVTSVASALAAVGEHPHDAVLVDAPLADPATISALVEEDPQAQVIVLGDPSGAEAVRAARAAGAADHLPKAGLDRDTLQRAVPLPRRPPPLGRAPPARRLPRPAHRAAQPQARHRPARPGARARSPGGRGGHPVLFLDLDRFKVVNDSFGHAVGDGCSWRSRERLEAAVRPRDTVGRLGGDEFTVLSRTSATRGRPSTSPNGLATLAHPIVLGGRELSCRASIGIAHAEPGTGAEDMFRDSDVAMYRAKERGRARIECSTPRCTATSSRAWRWRRTCGAPSRPGAAALYQPIVQSRDARRHRVRGPVRSEVEHEQELIAIAEETGLIVPLGHFVLREAARRAAEWGVCVSVNVSARQLADPGFAQAVEAALREATAAGRASACGWRSRSPR